MSAKLCQKLDDTTGIFKASISEEDYEIFHIFNQRSNPCLCHRLLSESVHAGLSEIRARDQIPLLLKRPT